MNVKTKQRIIGAVVLLAIIAIFSPFLFHHTSKGVESDITSKMPASPSEPNLSLHLPSVNVKQLQQIQAQATKTALVKEAREKLAGEDHQFAKRKTEQSEKKQTIAVSHEAPTKPKTPSSTSNTVDTIVSVPKAWVIQLGSFADKANAMHLVKKLREQGFDTYLRATNTEHGEVLTQVFIGPEIYFKKIQQLQLRLTKEFKLKGVIKRYHL